VRQNELRLQSKCLEKYEKVDEQKRQIWEAGLSKLQNDLSQSASSYISEQRERCAKTTQLSHIYVLGYLIWKKK